jgi:hypothetical protein
VIFSFHLLIRSVGKLVALYSVKWCLLDFTSVPSPLGVLVRLIASIDIACGEMNAKWTQTKVPTDITGSLKIRLTELFP